MLTEEINLLIFLYPVLEADSGWYIPSHFLKIEKKHVRNEEYN